MIGSVHFSGNERFFVSNKSESLVIIRLFEHETSKLCFKREINYQIKTRAMLSFVIGALIIAFIAGILGFTGIAKGLAALAKVVFYIFLVIFAITLIIGLINGF